MKLWEIAWKDIRIRLRDRKGLLSALLMPLLLTAILGAALGGVFNQEEGTLPSFEVAVYQGDEGRMGKALAEEVLQSDALRKTITILPADTAAAVEQSVKEGQADVGLVIPPGFTAQVTTGRPVELAVLQNPGKEQTGLILTSIVKSYTERVAAVSSAQAAILADVAQRTAGTTGAAPNIGQIAQDVIGELTAAAEAPNAAVLEKPVGKHEVSAKQYYAAAMAVMFLLFNATIGAKSILNERATETLSRMLSTPTAKSSILLGKFTGTLFFALLQFGVLFLATKYLFGVAWGDDLGQTLAVAGCYAVAVSGLSMALAAILRSEQAADVVSGVGVQICSVLGGSMVPLSQFPDLLQKAALVTPNAWALTSFTDIMTGVAWQALFLPLGVLLAIGAAALCFGTWRLAAR
ncbi:ABC-2 type transport system permease protein [Tumebacillus sp. BK434]|uniref:ABC transporter permease n=1 Tax=Tumebacillus sp. BK434 TaxID=2512169 RepID=UPI00104D0D8D|nr:ABC transporter permease [Tumebacillus sp. BK434]TCP58063.1 ABC-2 type transport system permease protein [Tumebacillus sp. BK434]